MKRVLLALALVGMTAGAAMAQNPYDLTGGVFICHHPPGLTYTTDPFDYCAAFTLSDCASQNTMVPGYDYGQYVWYIVSNFFEPKEFGGVEYGIQYGTDWNGAAAGICAPVEVLTIEYPGTGAWPGNGSAIAIALTAEPNWSGRFVATSFLWGYHYTYFTPGTVNLVPSPATDFIGWLTPTGTYSPDCVGSIGFDTPGQVCCSQPPAQWACCLPDFGGCVDMFEADCAAAGGMWMVDQLCADNPCPTPPVWACCLPDYGPCVELTAADCAAQGGVWYDGVLCSAEPCPTPPPVWACCLPDYTCVDMTEAECGTAGGVWYMGQLCVDNPCPPRPMACCLPDYAGCVDVYSQGECDALGGVLFAGNVCADDPCPLPPVWACCIGYDCVELTAADCAGQGGVWYEGVLCADNPCPTPPTAACCLPDCTCVEVTEADCLAQSGIWHEGLTCDPNPCEVTPNAIDSWGSIKSIYR